MDTIEKGLRSLFRSSLDKEVVKQIEQSLNLFLKPIACARPTRQVLLCEDDQLNGLILKHVRIRSLARGR